MTLFTTGDLAKRLGVPRPRIHYAIERAGILERTRAAGVRLFDRNQIPSIEAAVLAVRTGKGHRTDES